MTTTSSLRDVLTRHTSKCYINLGYLFTNCPSNHDKDDLHCPQLLLSSLAVQGKFNKRKVGIETQRKKEACATRHGTWSWRRRRKSSSSSCITKCQLHDFLINCPGTGSLHVWSQVLYVIIIVDRAVSFSSTDPSRLALIIWIFHHHDPHALVTAGQVPCRNLPVCITNVRTHGYIIENKVWNVVVNWIIIKIWPGGNPSVNSWRH